MALKNKIQPNHVSRNNYELQVIGLPPVTFTEISGIEETLDTVDLPDRTRASGGNTQATTFTASMPSHHNVEVLAMELWFKEAQDPVAPTYKKLGLLVQKNIGGEVVRSYSLSGMFPQKRTLSDMSFENEGEAAMIEWEFSVDDVVPTT